MVSIENKQKTLRKGALHRAFSICPGGPLHRRSSATSRPRCMLHELTLLHAARFLSFPPFSFSRVMLLQSTHTYGQSCIRLSFSPIPPYIRSFRFFTPMPRIDICLSADRFTGTRTHPYQHRTPQLTISPSFTTKTRSRMVCESHRTHGNKTRISSFTDPRTTICAPCSHIHRIS